MASSREQVLTCVLSKCLAAPYELPMAKTDPTYAAMVDLWCEQLRPFNPWELQEGMSILIQRRKNRKWPAVGEIAEACQEVRRDRLPPEQRGKLLEGPKKPERRDFKPGERELVAVKGDCRKRWEATGKMFACDRDKGGKVIRWHYSVADLTAEARAILAQRA